MKKQKYLQYIAAFLVCLILNMTIYIPVAYAAITKVDVKGSGGISNYAKENDFITFTVNANIPDTAIANDMIYAGSEIKFDKCTAVPSGGYECTLKYPASGNENWKAQSHSFQLNLYKDSGKKTIDDRKSGSFAIDNKAPDVKLSASKTSFSSADELIIVYGALDSACDDVTCSNKCSGIKSIDFYTLDNSFKKAEAISSGDCQAQGSISIDPKTLKDGKVSVFAKAADRLGQVSSPVSIILSIDNTAPSIVSDSFSISRKGIGISSFSQSSIPVEIFVNITGNDLNLNSVAADLSSLNPSQDLKAVKAQCSNADENKNVCRWQVDLKPATEGAKSIVINAFDSAGNKGTAAITKSLSLDSKGPAVLGLATMTTSDSKVLAKASGNKVTASFDESSGISADDAILHVGNLFTIKAASCSKDSTWVCMWENVDFGTVSSSKISIESDTTDVLGNQVVDSKSADVSVDSTVPVVKNVDIKAVGGSMEVFPGIFKAGDKIEVTASVLEDNEVSAVGDFSKFISDSKNFDAKCQKTQGNENSCVWLTDAINLAGANFIMLNFTDAAGNLVSIQKSLTVLGLDSGASPDYWTSTVTCSPKTVDRQIGTLINERVYCQVKLNPKSPSQKASTLFIGQASCSGDSSLVQNVETLNTESGSTSPIIKVTLKKSDFKINNASLSCSFNIYSKIASTNLVTKSPEIENANINLLFSNLPLGELSDEVQKKIKDAKEDALSLHRKIGSLNKLIFAFKKICQIMGVMYNIVSAYFTVTALLKLKADIAAASVVGAVASPPLAAAGTSTCFTQQAAHGSADAAWLVSNKFCLFINCQWAPGPLGKWQTFIKGKIDSLPGAKRLPGAGASNIPGLGPNFPQAAGNQPGLSSYMDPNSNLFVASLFGCIPGIIYGLDKYSQIKCLYADCLQNAVGKDGLPITVCEEQKNYATCKYIYGEIFAVNPYTAVFDHFAGIIKEALSNPFAAAGIGLGIACLNTCPQLPPASNTLYVTCEGFRVFSKLGTVAQNIKGLSNEGFKIRQDYCSRLEDSESQTAAATSASSSTLKP